MGLVQSFQSRRRSLKFQQDTGKAQVTVGISGTSGGFEFCAGQTDISNASRPILRLSYLTYQFFEIREIFRFGLRIYM